MAEDRSAGDLGGYRPVSGRAVAALLAGCGSALVLFTSLAAVLPLLAVVMAAAALADLRREEGRRAGRPLALAGLALAIGFSAQAIAAAVIDGWIMGGRASATAMAWVDAVRQGRFTDAAGLCSPAALPGPGGDPFAAGVSREDLQAAFRDAPAVMSVAACGEVRPPVTVSRSPAGDGGWIARVDLASCGLEGGSVTLRVAARTAARGRGTVERWLVTGFDLTRSNSRSFE